MYLGLSIEVMKIKNLIEIFTTIILILIITSACNSGNQNLKYVSNSGFVYGTIYHLTYESPNGIDLQYQVDSVLNKLDYSLSTFKKTSVLSKVNMNEPVVLDSFFIDVFKRSIEIFKVSEGAFDPTVAPLVNAWGFGFKHKEKVNQQLIDSILQFTGFPLIYLNGQMIEKKDPRVMLDFSSIAKGYSVDVVGDFLKSKGCKNYMVEIGGEIVAHGQSPSGRVWHIGINEPNDNEPINAPELQEIIKLSDVGLATSGNYRNFYIENGKKYAHTINPKSGYPVDHNLLSATVIARDCMTADALATAFMVMGTQKALATANKLNGVETYLIYDNENGGRAIAQTPGFKAYIVE